jgi:hypothetical protein
MNQENNKVPQSITDIVISWLNQEHTHIDIPLCDFEKMRHELKPCDVLLIEGRTRISNVIRWITASPWTHAALYVGKLHDIEDPMVRETASVYLKDAPESQFMIESLLGQGTVANPLSVYKNDHIRICRPKNISYKDAQQVIRYAVSRLGAEYDVRQIIDLARFLFPWFLLPRGWRSSLFEHNAGRSTKTVCSTMIAEAFDFVQFPILPLVKKTDSLEGIQLFRRNPKLCVPRDFDVSPYFEIIKYPYIDFTFHADYRLLPWKGSGHLTPEEAKYYMSTSDGDTGKDSHILLHEHEKITAHTHKEIPMNDNKNETKAENTSPQIANLYQKLGKKLQKIQDKE